MTLKQYSNITRVIIVLTNLVNVCIQCITVINQFLLMMWKVFNFVTNLFCVQAIIC